MVAFRFVDAARRVSCEWLRSYYIDERLLGQTRRWDIDHPGIPALGVSDVRPLVFSYRLPIFCVDAKKEVREATFIRKFVSP